MNILIIDDQPEFSDYLTMLLEQDFGHHVTCVPNGKKALELPVDQLAQHDVAIIDMMMPILDGFETGRQMKQQVPHIVIIMLTGYPSIETVIRALRDFKFDDYLPKTELDDSNNPRILREILIKAEKISESRKAHSNEYKLSNTFRSQTVEVHRELIGTSNSFQQVRRLIEQTAPTDSTILILGETGTGKELVAREIHRQSQRRLKPFVPINCSAIPSGLLESELFGHKKGAFTGAFGNKTGFFQLANGGTLFLDEIGDMPVDLQSRLLRVLQEQEFFPVGSNKLSDAIRTDVRILSATHQDLKKKIKKKTFRKDLFYRLNTITIPLPSLRERISDIELLIRYFITQKSNSKRIKGLTPDALKCLQQWSWEGNIRELEHVIERAILVSTGDYLSSHDLPKEIQINVSSTPSSMLPSTPESFPGSDYQLVKGTFQEGISFNSTQNYQQLWETFKNHDFKLWTIQNDESVKHQLKTILNGAKYIKKGHFGRLMVTQDAELQVTLQYINTFSCQLEETTILFEFKTEESFDHLPKKRNVLKNTTPNFVTQPVLRGLPDTYFFNILYPPPKQNNLYSVFPQQVIKIIILRYAQTHASTKSLKKIFEQTMSFLIDPTIVKEIHGLTKDGLEATRAYLTGENHIFFGLSRKIKSEPEFIQMEIQKIFPE